MSSGRATALTFLTWNLALLERSAQAPPDWDPNETEAAVRALVLEAAPDVVLFQELPGLVPFVETHDMIRANPRSHSGNLATLVRHELLEPEPAVRVIAGSALLVTLPDRDLTIANVHLAPGRGSAATRLDQLAAVVEAAPAQHLLIAGDTNTRVDEIPAIEDAGLHSAHPPEPTWDSSRNRFRDEAPEFTAYFTRWIASPEVTVNEVVVWSDPHESRARRFHLSDHYALSGTAEWCPTVAGG